MDSVKARARVQPTPSLVRWEVRSGGAPWHRAPCMDSPSFGDHPEGRVLVQALTVRPAWGWIAVRPRGWVPLHALQPARQLVVTTDPYLLPTDAVQRDVLKSEEQVGPSRAVRPRIA